MLQRTLLTALGAAGLYAVVLAATGSVELGHSRIAPTSGGVLTLAVDLPIAEPSTDGLLAAPDSAETVTEPVPVATPSPEPTPTPPDVAPAATEPAGQATPPDRPAGAPDAPPSTGVDATDAGVVHTGGTKPPGGSPDSVAADNASQEHASPPAKTNRPHGDENSESRAGELERSAPHAREPTRHPAGGRRAGGAPALGAPVSGAPMPSWQTPIAMPDFVIDEFRIPPFLLAIYQAAGTQYGLRWEILAAINEIETNYGRNLDVSSAGALGWMQFLPSTWETYGVDADADGRKDPFNPVDAIFAAARYLRASGADTDIRKAVYAYNHADWYVDAVIARAEALGRLPSGLVESLAGMARGRFPVRARRGRAALRSSADDRRIEIVARAGARVIAVNEGRVVRAGRSARFGRFIRLLDVYGNTYTYAHLARTLVDQGARVRAGATVGGLGRRPGTSAPYLRFAIRPAGRGAPRIDPKPILQGWKLLKSTAIHDEDRSNPFLGAGRPTIGQIVLMSKATLARRVLADPDVHIYDCGRSDIGSGQIDVRVLATLEFLAASGLAPTVSSLRCGHGYLTASGNVSEHSSGSAVDIAAINGIPIAGHQGAGSITDFTIQRLLTLQGAMKPHQIISLMTFEGADNALAMADHADHIHVGFRPD